MTAPEQGAPLAAWAAWYASHGVPVFPLRPGHKKPLRDSHGVDDATTDAATVAAWWKQHPRANIGAACGVRFDVVDVDGPQGAASLDALYPDGWPATVARARSPRPGGLHCYLPPMGAPVKAGGRGGLPQGVDTRGAGGYVVLPPSTLVELRDATGAIDQHAGVYAWQDDAPPAFGPADVATVRACKPWRRVWDTPAPVAAPTAPRAPLTHSDGTTRYGVRVLSDEAATVAGAAPGGRNDALNRAAFKVGQLVPHEVTETDAAAALLDAARACGLPDAEARATLASGLGDGKQHPRQPETRPSGVTERYTSGALRMATGERVDPTTGEILDAEPDAGQDASDLHPEAEGPTADVLAERVFGATPTLRHIREAAHARLVVPWAVLGAVLARVVAEVPPFVVLPPTVATDASLNLAVALVADSGGGKSGAVGCAADVVRIGHRYAQDIGPGSGEGIMQAFLERDPDAKGKGAANRIRTHPLALLAADEIAHVGAVQGRTSGATFAPIVRTMLTGGPVATSAVDEDRRRNLPAHSYRLCVVAGVQPRLSDVLLNDTDAGTPQRWLWLPADDPTWNAPPTRWPGRLDWTCPRLPNHDPDGRVRLAIPDEAVAAITDARVRRLRREGDPLDGHRLLTREKVAAALALLHGEAAITPDWWELAGLVMHRSDVTRAHCAQALTTKAEAEHRARGRLDAARESGAREARTGEATKHARAIWRTVASPTRHNAAKHDPGEGCTSRCIATALRNHKGADKAAALAVALDLAWIEERDGRYHAGPGQPSEAPA